MTRRDISEQIDAIFSRKGGYKDGQADGSVGFNAPPISPEMEKKIEALAKERMTKGFGKR
jgi:hypothetical protein